MTVATCSAYVLWAILNIHAPNWTPLDTYLTLDACKAAQTTRLSGKDVAADLRISRLVCLPATTRPQ